MGAGLGGALRAGGARVVATVEGRSARTRRLADEAGLELLPSLADVVAAADILLVVTPPGDAVAAATAIRRAAGRDTAAIRREAGEDAAEVTRRRPLVADLNAVSPGTMSRVEAALGGLDLVDGSISGPPPSDRPGARLYLSGARAAEVAALPWDGQVEPVVLGDRVGAASALKMCTGSVYKGLTALVTQAMRTAGAYGVLDEVVLDLDRNGLAQTRGVARSATKAWRFVDEMREVAATQEAAGLTPDLFTAIAAVYAQVAGTALAQGDPESAPERTAAEIVDMLRE
jgi:3-hydroxyisobutyrate dehydrogenase-like beta-hydroxyacid dehydrogenase